jgi:uncharacterized protein (TIGR00369 family)
MNEEKVVLESAERVNERLKDAKSPFIDSLRVRVVEASDDGLVMETAVREEWGNVFGSMHGGVTASLVDTAVGVAVLRVFGFARAVTTVELKVNYLRPIHAGKVTVRAKLLKTGKTLIVGAGDVYDAEGEHCATSLVTYMAL